MGVIQSSINQAVSLAGLLYSASPTLQEMSRLKKMNTEKAAEIERLGGEVEELTGQKETLKKDIADYQEDLHTMEQAYESTAEERAADELARRNEVEVATGERDIARGLMGRKQKKYYNKEIQKFHEVRARQEEEREAEMLRRYSAANPLAFGEYSIGDIPYSERIKLRKEIEGGF